MKINYISSLYIHNVRKLKSLQYSRHNVNWVCKESLAVMGGDGSQMLRGRKPYLMGMDTTGVVMDGDGLISHYRAGL